MAETDWNGTAWQALGDGVTGGDFPTVWAVTVFNNELVVGGRFTSAGGSGANYIARWNGTIWQPLRSASHAAPVLNGSMPTGLGACA